MGTVPMVKHKAIKVLIIKHTAVIQDSFRAPVPALCPASARVSSSFREKLYTVTAQAKHT